MALGLIFTLKKKQKKRQEVLPLYYKGYQAGRKEIKILKEKAVLLLMKTCGRGKIRVDIKYSSSKYLLNVNVPLKLVT